MTFAQVRLENSHRAATKYLNKGISSMCCFAYGDATRWQTGNRKHYKYSNYFCALIGSAYIVGRAAGGVPVADCADRVGR